MILKELRAQVKIPDPPLAGTKSETYPNSARLKTQRQKILPSAVTKSKNLPHLSPIQYPDTENSHPNNLEPNIQTNALFLIWPGLKETYPTPYNFLIQIQ